MAPSAFQVLNTQIKVLTYKNKYDNIYLSQGTINNKGDIAMKYTITSNNGHKYAHTHVIIDADNTVTMYSYTTPVIRITMDGWLSCNGLYSRTTIKHIGWFMRERGFNYYLAKQLYLDNKEMNVYTGECRDRV